jgi:hypothetical protein
VKRTFTLPDGEKITTRTRYRYVLINQSPDRPRARINQSPDRPKAQVDDWSAYPGALEGRIGTCRRLGSGDTETGELTGYQGDETPVDPVTGKLGRQKYVPRCPVCGKPAPAHARNCRQAEGSTR